MTITLFCITNPLNKGDEAARIAIKELLEKKLKDKVHQISIEKIGLLTEKEIRKIRQSSLIIIGGGGHYSKWFQPTEYEKLNLGVPIAIYSLGYLRNFGDTDLTRKQKKSIKLINKLSFVSSSRDKNTQNYLKKIGIKTMLVCDPAVFLEIKKPKTKTTKKKNRKTIGINIAAHGWKMQDKHLTKVIKAYTGFCLKLEKLNYKIVYFKHSPGEEKAIEELEKKVKLRVIRGSSKKLLKEYKKVDYFIGMMLHSTILAFNANKPMISICYDHKNHDFMKLIGMNKYYLHYNKLNSKKIFELFQKLKENENKIQKNFKKKKKLLWKAHERFLRKVDKIRK